MSHLIRWSLVVSGLFVLAGFQLASVSGSESAVAADSAYKLTTLASDGGVPALRRDQLLINAWGLAHSADGPWFVAAADASSAVIYDGAANPKGPAIHVQGGPTGVVYNATHSFVIRNGIRSGPAQVLFATESGMILGWIRMAPSPEMNDAFVAVDNGAAGALYKGLAMLSTVDGDFLYAADFRNAKVDVYDGAFKKVVAAGAFVDPGIPAGYAPFGIQAIGNRVFVTYAKQSQSKSDEVPGPGLGFVSMFDSSGAFAGRVAGGGVLNAPWGLAVAPPNFGTFGGHLLVANFGDGRINVYSMGDFKFRGQIRDARRLPIVVDGLWGIGFGNGGLAGPSNALYFAAGPNDEADGAFGVITLDGG